MRALFYAVAALVAVSIPGSWAFLPPFFGSYREASQNYYEIMTHCDQEGGDCIDVDFGYKVPEVKTPEPKEPKETTPAPTTTRRPTTRRPTTRAPPPPPVTVPIFVNFPAFFNPFSFFWQPTTPAPPLPLLPRTPVPRPTTRAPPPTTRAPVPKTTRAPVKTTKAPKKPRKGRKPKRGGEREREVRRKRNIDTYNYLYSECSGGWEFDVGCGVKGNVCCYSANSGSSHKKKK